jgi:hypothetical protein
MSVRKWTFLQSHIFDTITSLQTSKRKTVLAVEGDQVNAQKITMYQRHVGAAGQPAHI